MTVRPESFLHHWTHSFKNQYSQKSPKNSHLFFGVMVSQRGTGPLPQAASWFQQRPITKRRYLRKQSVNECRKIPSLHFHDYLRRERKSVLLKNVPFVAHGLIIHIPNPLSVQHVPISTASGQKTIPIDNTKTTYDIALQHYLRAKRNRHEARIDPHRSMVAENLPWHQMPTRTRR